MRRTFFRTFLLPMLIVNLSGLQAQSQSKPPAISDIANQTINEDSSTGATAFTVSDPDTSVNLLTLSGNSSNPTLVPNANIIFGGAGANRTVTVTPAPDQSGTATITVSVTDGVAKISDTFVLTVNAVNKPPTISDIANQTIDEDNASAALAFTVGDAETPLANLTVSGSSSNPGLVPTANIVFGGSGANRTVTVTPALNQAGSATISVSVTDGSSRASDTFLLTVNAVNDPPTISDIPNQAINENTSTGPLGFTVGDVESGPSNLTPSGSSSNTALIPEANIVFGGSGANRTVTVTPAPNQSGTATITVSVTDGAAKVSDTFVLTVNAVNKPPTISDIANQTINEDNATAALAFTVGDVETPLANLSVSGSSSNPALVPSANIVFGGSGANRTVIVTPVANQSGTATITVTVSDGTLRATDTFTVTIEERSNPCDLTCNGRDFWLTFPGNYAPEPTNPGTPQLCILGSPGTTVTVTGSGLSFSTTVTIPPAMSVNVTLPAAADLGNANDLVENKGVHVVASAPVSVYALSQVKYTSDGYLALPTEVLGTEHYILAYRNVHAAVPQLNGSQFALVACEPNTTVTITPSIVTGVRDSGIPYTLTLNAGQTYQLRATSGALADLTGTHIISDKPIAVFGSHRCASINSFDESFCDYVVEQLPPVNRWAAEFYTRPLVTRTGGDAVRVIASQNGTTVSLNGLAAASLDAGQFYETVRSIPTQITADRPVLVAQYASSSDFDVVPNSDPFMALVPGRPQFSPEHKFCLPALGFLTHHINVIVPSAAVGSVLLDGGAPPGLFLPIGLSGYSQATVAVAPGVHTLTAAQPVGVIAYGWNEYESYGWPVCLFFGDTTPPVLACPTNEIRVTVAATGPVSSSCRAPVPDLRGQVHFTDNCGLPDDPVVEQQPNPGTLLGVGVHEIVLSVTDAAGNVGRCVVPFIVVDSNPNGPLTLECPPDKTVSCADPNGTVVDFQAHALRGCTPVPVECTPPTGSLFPPGVTPVTCRLNDPANPLTCTFTVTVECQPIEVTLVGTSVIITWTGAAALESANDISGPWTPVLGAKPPFTVVPEGTGRFFRVR